MKINTLSLTSIVLIAGLSLSGCVNSTTVEFASPEITKDKAGNTLVAEQRATLAKNTEGKGFGAQAPRDIDAKGGTNTKELTTAPASTAMNLCNIHFHKNAEHKGGEFTQYAGNGDGHGYKSGYKYTGTLSDVESSAFSGGAICKNDHSALYSGDTIEVHYVYSSDDVKPGATLGACLAKDRTEGQPALRVETQVYVVVNDTKALDFGALTKVSKENNLYQAVNIPSNTGTAIAYEGSTTGPGYNEKASPLQVTWSVRPNVAKVNIASVGNWCKGNDFKEDHGHGVRNIVINPDLLSPIK